MYLAINTTETFKNMFNVFQTLDSSEVIIAIIEVLIIAFVIYYVLTWVKNTRAWTLLKGVIIIALFVFLAKYFEFKVIYYIISRMAFFAFIALVVIFQEDLRKGLEKLGRQKFFSKLLPNFNPLTKKTSETVVQEIVEAVFTMAKGKVGALIVIEQTESLEEIERTGISINGKVSKQLLMNIFEKNTPLHDGAVLIVGDIIKAATCYLPLTRNSNISKDFGTRHRAALGVSEISDSETIVVSEETGKISVCARGRIKTINDSKELVKELLDTIYVNDKKKEKVSSFLKGWFVNDKKV